MQKTSLLFSLAAAITLLMHRNVNSQTAVDSPVHQLEQALAPVTPNTAPGTEYAEQTRCFQGIPGIERSRGGRLWATWYAGGRNEPGEGPGNYVVLVTSGDGGQTWSGPSLVIDPPGNVRAYDACVWLDPGGKLWLFWAQSYGAWDGRVGVWAIHTSNADSATPRWSEPVRIVDGIMMNKPTVLRSGEWVLPVAVWNCLGDKPLLRMAPGIEVNAGAVLPIAAEQRLAWVVVSRDKGKSWQRRGGVNMPKRSYDEHSIIERRDGSLWMLARTHAGIAESTSIDGGQTWTPGKRSGIPHVDARFFIRRLQSGNLLLVTHNPPDGSSRSHLTAWLSADDGKTWKGGLSLDARFGVSYPDGFQAPDGTITVIYDYNRTTDKQILLASFTESDVLAGTPKSAQTRQRVVVNAAPNHLAALSSE